MRKTTSSPPLDVLGHERLVGGSGIRATPGDDWPCEKLLPALPSPRLSRERTETMATFGTNLKLTIDKDRRSEVRALFVDVLGATAVQPTPALEAYKLADGGSVGVFYVDAKEALSSEDQMKGAWLEFRVDDPESLDAKLKSRGVTRIDYQDKSHAYYQVPGGPVFRLARSAG
jgi:hypothetical protein